MNIRQLIAFIFISFFIFSTSAFGEDVQKSKELFIRSQCDKRDPTILCLKSPVDNKSQKTWQEMLSQVLLMDSYQESVNDVLVKGFMPGTSECQLDTSATLQNIQAQISGDWILTIINMNSCVLMTVFEKKPSHKLISSMTLGNMGGSEMGGEDYEIESIYPVSLQAQAIWVMNDHENSGESFENFKLIWVNRGQMKVVYDGPFLYSVKDPPNTLFFSATIKMLPTSQEGHPDFEVTVGERKQYKSKKSLKEYTWTIAWNPQLQKYMGGSKSLLQRMKSLRSE